MVSRLHQKVGEVLSVTPGFIGVTLRQEVSVRELFPEYGNGRDKYDWVIPTRTTVIECMGIQHEKLQTFGGDAGKAQMNFETMKRRDASKKEIALLNGWTYLLVPYTDEKLITKQYLHDLYMANLNTDTVSGATEVPGGVRFESKQEIKHRQQLEIARGYRKKQYQKQKELKNANKRSRS